MMTRKDYVKVADILKQNKNNISPNAFQDMVQDFCDMFFEDNPNFSPNRFELACYGNDEMEDVK